MAVIREKGKWTEEDDRLLFDNFGAGAPTPRLSVDAFTEKFFKGKRSANQVRSHWTRMMERVEARRYTRGDSSKGDMTEDELLAVRVAVRQSRPWTAEELDKLRSSGIESRPVAEISRDVFKYTRNVNQINTQWIKMSGDAKAGRKKPASRRQGATRASVTSIPAVSWTAKDHDIVVARLGPDAPLPRPTHEELAASGFRGSKTASQISSYLTRLRKKNLWPPPPTPVSCRPELVGVDLFSLSKAQRKQMLSAEERKQLKEAKERRKAALAEVESAEEDDDAPAAVEAHAGDEGGDGEAEEEEEDEDEEILESEEEEDLESEEEEQWEDALEGNDSSDEMALDDNSGVYYGDEASDKEEVKGIDDSQGNDNATEIENAVPPKKKRSRQEKVAAAEARLARLARELHEMASAIAVSLRADSLNQRASKARKLAKKVTRANRKLQLLKPGWQDAPLRHDLGSNPSFEQVASVFQNTALVVLAAVAHGSDATPSLKRARKLSRQLDRMSR